MITYNRLGKPLAGPTLKRLLDEVNASADPSSVILDHIDEANLARAGPAPSAKRPVESLQAQTEAVSKRVVKLVTHQRLSKALDTLSRAAEGNASHVPDEEAAGEDGIKQLKALHPEAGEFDSTLPSADEGTKIHQITLEKLTRAID
jgi:hypothetical protein